MVLGCCDWGEYIALPIVWPEVSSIMGTMGPFAGGSRRGINQAGTALLSCLSCFLIPLTNCPKNRSVFSRQSCRAWISRWASSTIGLRSTSATRDPDVDISGLNGGMAIVGEAIIRDNEDLDLRNEKIYLLIIFGTWDFPAWLELHDGPAFALFALEFGPFFVLFGVVALGFNLGVQGHEELRGLAGGAADGVQLCLPSPTRLQHFLALLQYPHARRWPFFDKRTMHSFGRFILIHQSHTFRIGFCIKSWLVDLFKWER